MWKFFHELIFGAMTIAHYITDDVISGNLSDLSLLIYQIGINNTHFIEMLY